MYSHNFMVEEKKDLDISLTWVLLCFIALGFLYGKSSKSQRIMKEISETGNKAEMERKRREKGLENEISAPSSSDKSKVSKNLW